MSGVSAIQQTQLWSKGGKQAVQRSPLEIAASHGQNRSSFTTGDFIKLASPFHKGEGRVRVHPL